LRRWFFAHLLVVSMATPQHQYLEAQEQQNIQKYIEDNNINDLMADLVEAYLNDRPMSSPKQHFANSLRMSLTKEETPEEQQEQIVAEITSAAQVPGDALKRLFEAMKQISSEIVPMDTIRMIIEASLKLLNCDRLSLFIYDKRMGMLVLNASNLEHPIRVKPGQGIAGSCFKTQQTVNIPNCYNDPRFDQTFDMKTGYRTSNLLTMPIIDFEGECMGVIQAINKLEIDSPGFSRVDEILLDSLMEHVSIALRNAEVYRAAIETAERSNALLNMLQSVSEDLGVQSTVLSVATHASELVRADRCSVFLVDDTHGQLFSIASDSGKEIRIPKSAGIAGECATDCKLIVIDDAYEDSRFNQEFDKKSGYRTKSIIAVPVKRSQRNSQGVYSAVAVIQMINKTEFDGEIGRFDDEDVQVLETFATFVATKFATSSLLSKAHHGHGKNQFSEDHGFPGDLKATDHQHHPHGGRRPSGTGIGDHHEARILESEEDEAEDTFS